MMRIKFLINIIMVVVVDRKMTVKLILLFRKKIFKWWCSILRIIYIIINLFLLGNSIFVIIILVDIFFLFTIIK